MTLDSGKQTYRHPSLRCWTAGAFRFAVGLHLRAGGLSSLGSFRATSRVPFLVAEADEVLVLMLWGQGSH